MPIARTRFGVGLRVLLVVVLAGAAGGAPITVAQAKAPAEGAAQAAVTTASPVGTWAATVTVEGVPPFPATFRFTPHGLALVSGRGAGVWYSTGAGSFTFRVAEGNFTTDGVFVGWLSVQQNPTLNGDTFTSSGVTTVYDVSDNVTRTANVTITATRTQP